MNRTKRTFPDLIQRFRDAYYDRIPDALRIYVRDEFCDQFNIKFHYFQHKLVGANGTSVTEDEIKWMDECDVVAISQKQIKQKYGPRLAKPA